MTRSLSVILIAFTLVVAGVGTPVGAGSPTPSDVEGVTDASVAPDQAQPSLGRLGQVDAGSGQLRSVSTSTSTAGSSDGPVTQYTLTNPETGVSFSLAPGEPLADLGVPAGTYLVDARTRSDGEVSERTFRVDVSTDGTVTRLDSTEDGRVGTDATSGSDSLGVAVTAGLGYDESYASDAVVNISVAAVDESGPVPRPVGSVETTVTIRNESGDVVLTRTLTSSASGATVVPVDASTLDDGRYGVTASLSTGATAETDFSVGPTLAVYPRFGDHVEVGRPVDVRVALHERGSPVGQTTADVEVRFPNGTTEVRTVDIGPDGFGTLTLTAQEAGDLSISPASRPGHGTWLTAGDVLGQLRTNGGEYSTYMLAGDPVQLTGYVTDDDQPAANRDVVVRIYNTTDYSNEYVVTNISTTTNAYGQYAVEWQTPQKPGTEFEARLYTADGTRIPQDGGRINLEASRNDGGSGGSSPGLVVQTDLDTQSWQDIVGVGASQTATVEVTNNGSAVDGATVEYALVYGDATVAANGTVTTNATGEAVVSIPVGPDAPDGADLRLVTATTVDGQTASDTASGEVQRYRIDEDRLGSTVPGETATYELTFTNASTGAPVSGVDTMLTPETTDSLHGVVFDSATNTSVSDGDSSMTVTLPGQMTNEFLYGPLYPYFDWGFPTFTVEGYDVQVQGLPDREVQSGETVTFNYTAASPDATGATALLRTYANGGEVAPVSLTVNEGSDASFTVPSGIPSDRYSLVVRTINGSSTTATEYASLEINGSSAANAAPTADAGSDRSASPGETVTLDATGSNDPDGDTLDFQWRQVSGPNVDLTDAGTATPTFTVPADASGVTFTFEVSVSDGALTATDRVSVYVAATSGGGGGGTAAPPTWTEAGNDSRNTGANPAAVGPKANPELQWRVETARLKSSPAVVDGVVYAADGSGTVMARNATTGAEQWNRTLGSRIRSAPLVENGTVYIGGEYGAEGLWALDADTGTTRWHVPTNDYVISPATIDDGTVFFGTNDGRAIAANARTGAVEWNRTVGGQAWGPVAAHNGTVYVQETDGVHALDADTGGEQWVFDGGDLEFGPTVGDGRVYVVSDDSNAVYALDAETGNVTWEYADTALYQGSPALWNDTVYVPVGDELLAFDAGSGALSWSTPMEFSSTSTAVADGVLYATDNRSVVALDPSTGEEFWRSSAGVEDFLAGRPAVANGTVYVGQTGDIGTGALVAITGDTTRPLTSATVDGAADGDDAFASIQAAVDAVEAGGTVTVESGTYNETVVVNKSVDLVGAPGDTSAGPASDRPVLDGGGRNATAINISSGTSDVRIAGFEIRNYTGLSPGGIGAVANTSDVTITDNYVHDTGFAGIGIVRTENEWSGHTRYRIERNRVADSIINVGVGHATDSVVSNNHITGSANLTAFARGSYSGVQIYSGDGSRTTRNVTVSNNTVRGTFTDGGSHPIGLFAIGQDGTNNSIEDVTIAHNDIDASVDERGINIVAWSRQSNLTGRISDVEVSDNDVTTHNANDVIAIGGSPGGNGIHENITVSDNRLDGGNETTDKGVFLYLPGDQRATDVVVRDNVLQDVVSEVAGVRTEDNATAERVTLTNNTLTNGGRGVALAVIDNSTLSGTTITDNDIVDNRGPGIDVYDQQTTTVSDIRVTENRIHSNDAGVTVDSPGMAAALEIHRNSFENNTNHGVENPTTTVVNATYNYWGASDGPGGDYGGSGDAVYGDVLVEPFYTDADLTTLGPVESEPAPTVESVVEYDWGTVEVAFSTDVRSADNTPTLTASDFAAYVNGERVDIVNVSHNDGYADVELAGEVDPTEDLTVHVGTVEADVSDGATETTPGNQSAVVTGTTAAVLTSTATTDAVFRGTPVALYFGNESLDQAYEITTGQDVFVFTGSTGPNSRVAVFDTEGRDADSYWINETDGGSDVTRLELRNLSLSASVNRTEFVAPGDLGVDVAANVADRNVDVGLFRQSTGLVQVRTLTLAGDGTASATFSVSEAGEYAVEVRDVASGVTAAADPVTVTEGASFAVSSLSAPISTSAGDRVAVTAEVENTGGTNGSTPVTFTFDGQTVTRNVSLPAGETADVVATFDTSVDARGTQSVTVDTGDDTASAGIEFVGQTFTCGVSTGDPHLVTFDGVAYDFQAAGEFTLLQAPNGTLDVQVRQVPAGDSRSVAMNNATATVVDGREVMIDIGRDVPLYVDGTAVALASGESVSVGDGMITRSGDTYTIVYPGDDGVANATDERLEVTMAGDHLDLKACLHPDRNESVEGLLGSPNGDTGDDFALDNGTVLGGSVTSDILYDEYRDSWRVTTDESLFYYREGRNASTYADPLFPETVVTLSDLDAAAREEAERLAVEAGLEPGTAAFRDAVLDYVLTGETSYFASAQRGSTTNVSVDTDSTAGSVTFAVESGRTVRSNASTTVDLVVENVTDGVGAYEVSVRLENASVASLTGGTVADSPYLTDVRVGPNNETVSIATVGLDTVDNGSVTVGTLTVRGETPGETALSVETADVGTEGGVTYDVSVENGSLTVTGLDPVVGDSVPTDPDGDGLYEDVNGDGEVTIVDIQAMFANYDSEAVQNNPAAFDFNDSGSVDIVDVQRLFASVV